MTRDEFLKVFPRLTKNYKPSPDSLERIKALSLLIVIGPTGVGKSSIINQLGIPYVPTDVTRPARPEEKDGTDMFFRTDYDQLIEDIKQGGFLQFVVGASGDFYGTRASSYPDSAWAVMTIIADGVPFSRRLGFKDTLSVFITPPSYDEWMRRLGSHHTKPEELQKRFAEAKRSFEFVLNDKKTHFILNDEVEAAVGQIKRLIGGTIDKQREAEARKDAENNYQELLKH